MSAPALVRPLHGPALVQGWNHAAALLCTQAVLVLLYRDTALSMPQTWVRSDTYAHGFLVLPIVLWLLWRQRASLTRQPLQPQPAWLALVLPLGLLWLLGELAAVNPARQTALLALLVLAVPVLLGTRLAGRMRFALAYAFFAVPLGDFLLPPLMDWTTALTVQALRHSGIPVLRVGNSFSTPSGNWAVVEACSGVRYLIASIMLGTLYAHLCFRSLALRLRFVLAALLLPLLANGLRAYLIVLLGYLSNNQLATGVDHVLYGWLFFGLLMGLLFAWGAHWREPGGSARSARPAAAPIGPGRDRAHALHWLQPWGLAALLLLLASAGPLLLQALQEGAGPPVALGAGTAVAPAAPVLAPRWPLLDAATPFPQPALQPRFRNPSLQWQGSFGSVSQPVGLYLALYRQPLGGSSLVGAGNGLLAGIAPHWDSLGQGQQVLTLGSRQLRLARWQLQPVDAARGSQPEDLLVWQLYWLPDHTTTSPALVKLLGAWRRLSGRNDAAAVLLVYTASGSGGAGAARLHEFLQDNYALVEAWLQRAALSGVAGVSGGEGGT